MHLKLVLLAAALCLAACGHRQQQSAAGQPSASVAATPSHHIFGPVPKDCVFPDANELAILASASTVAAIGQADRAQVVHRPGRSIPYTRHTFHIQSIVLGAAGGETLVIEEIGDVPLPFEPGQYLLFLSQNGPTYYITNGLYGAFPLRANGVVRECPPFSATAALQEAPGSGVLLQDFTKTLRSLPTVAVPHR
jgi:hypothetical protein